MKHFIFTLAFLSFYVLLPAQKTAFRPNCGLEIGISGMRTIRYDLGMGGIIKWSILHKKRGNIEYRHAIRLSSAYWKKARSYSNESIHDFGYYLTSDSNSKRSNVQVGLGYEYQWILRRFRLSFGSDLTYSFSTTTTASCYKYYNTTIILDQYKVYETTQANRVGNSLNVGCNFFITPKFSIGVESFIHVFIRDRVTQSYRTGTLTTTSYKKGGGGGGEVSALRLLYLGYHF